MYSVLSPLGLVSAPPAHARRPWAVRVQGVVAMLPSRRPGWSSVWGPSSGGAFATEQAQPSTPGIAIAFANIDWKQSRHTSQEVEKRNKIKFQETMASII